MASIPERLHEARECRHSRPRQAIEVLQGILRERPNHGEALELLATIYLQQQEPDRAHGLLQRALQAEAPRASTHFLLGVVLKSQGQVGESVRHYQTALRLEPHNPATHYNLGNALFTLNKLREAAHHYQCAIQFKPDFTDAFYSLGNVLLRTKDPQSAMAAYLKALSLEPRRDDILVDLGQALQEVDRQEEAVTCFRQALELNSRSVSALNNLGNALRRQGHVDQALEYLRKAIELQPENAVLQNSLGVALETLGDIEGAFGCYRKALQQNAEYSIAHYNLANLELHIGNLDAAEAGYRRAVSINPEDAEAHYHLGCLWLLRGEYTRAAWEEFEWRWKMRVARGKRRRFPQPAWDGSPLEGKTILLHAEMGFGDTLQFVRYARLVQEQAASVLVECPRRLVKILSQCVGIDHVLGRGEALPRFDVHAALMSLPGLLNTRWESVPAVCPYLWADADRVERWKRRLAPLTDFRVGIAWQGKPTFLRDKSRSIPLKHFLVLAEVPRVQWVSLQKGPGMEQLAGVKGVFDIQDLGTEMDGGEDAFVDTAAIMHNLDLVITSDTSIAHLAGGMGVPVWVALSYVPDWRWGLDRGDTPWYPTMRLFRQPRPGDWNATFNAIQTELSDLVQQQPVGKG